MKITSMIAIYFLFLCLSAFMLLPFSYARGKRTDEPLVPGQAESAPARFDVRRHMIVSAAIAAGLFALFYGNYMDGWIKVQDLDFFNPPEQNDNIVG
ncbi:DUF1467 family protein [Sphingomonas sp. ASV193]|uniref:DUF1467 family protein n=1 Tax=Sphingomonas sp. ASV193 TaxID=3144405 RepID=UPI0032E8850C